ncbi:MAG: hypothetical protein AAF602_18765 [Myxococcota bacterium]
MWVWLGLLVGCGGPDEELLESLAGTWSGDAMVSSATFPISATFDYTGFLSGELSVGESEGTVSYGIRRADAFNGAVDLDLQRTGENQFLTLEGDLTGGVFTGDIIKTFECGEPQPCGYVGTFSITSSGPAETGP